MYFWQDNKLITQSLISHLFCNNHGFMIALVICLLSIHYYDWWFGYLGLGFGAKVLRFLPAACGQVEDGGGSHMSGLGIVGVIIGGGGALPVTVETQAGR